LTPADILPGHVARARKSLGLSRARLAELAGVPTSVIGKIERGDVANPGIAYVAAIAEALAVTIDWLATGRGPRRRR
jgi:transcriptional regulator with XRE-family HTH domain